MGKEVKPQRLERHEAIAELKDIVRRLEIKIDRIERVIDYLQDNEDDELTGDVLDGG